MNKRLDIDDFALLLSIILIWAIYVINPTYFIFSIIVTGVTILTEIINRKRGKWDATKFVKFSIFFFIIGVFVANTYVPAVTEAKINNVYIPVAVMIVIYMFALLIHLIITSAKEKTVKNAMSNRSGIKGFEELLKAVRDKGGNVLAVAGNLLSLKTEKGIDLLKTFLNGDSSNKLKLIISKESKKYLRNIKDKINLDVLVSQVSVLVYEPFWFLQGIVIIGKTASEYEHAMAPLGCYYYKIKFSEGEDMAEDGLYIDLSKQDIYTDYPQAINAYYFLLNTLKYSQSPYEVEKVFKKNSQPYDPRIYAVNWNDV